MAAESLGVSSELMREGVDVSESDCGEELEDNAPLGESDGTSFLIIQRAT